MLAACTELLALNSENATVLLDVGTLLYTFGFLTQARDCFTQALNLGPKDMRPLVNLANVARDAGDHNESGHLYAFLQERLPNHPVVRRNALVCLEYDPDTSDKVRLTAARTWGKWAVTQAGGPYPKPRSIPLENRSLRVGYVSADFCLHPVGLLVKDVLKMHNPAHVVAYAYSAGQVSDWVTSEIRQCCFFHDISSLDDRTFADRIRNNKGTPNKGTPNNKGTPY